MSKRPVIDRDMVLDAAENVVMQQGVAALTIGEVARAAGISKGGVQSCFGTRDGLVEAMFNRWKAEFETTVRTIAEDEADPQERLRAHVALMAGSDEGLGQRAAAILAAMHSNEGLRQQASDWYRPLLLQAEGDDDKSRNTRLAFLAAKGAFLLRSFGIMEMSDSEWQTIFREINSLLDAAD
ncbi:TetR/AcrR family transcriptional regulator [Pseudomonas citronellolis]|uniref:TetR/AcrR family transcriptional regulator n=1 Tax=Pseudomonas citronellolis TaxID=53408 RepID=UPI0023E4204C|nr:TetR/AcrR family transcriptional regulator [Pseudomonas citronellolis]MDF3933426.1 TetR/AcrR family transcriptional regulator [Pseudomonas citronellolis]